MFSKINVTEIVKDHLDTLRDYATGKIMIGDIIIFFIFPLLAALFVVFILQFLLTDAAANVLVTSLSVFSALLFNLLLLIYDIIRKEERHQKPKNKMPKFLKEIYSNISFSILIAVICIAILLLTFLDISNQYFNHFLSFTVYFLVSLFILTLFMILKRIHVLLKKEIDSTDKEL